MYNKFFNGNLEKRVIAFAAALIYILSSNPETDFQKNMEFVNILSTTAKLIKSERRDQ